MHHRAVRPVVLVAVLVLALLSLTAMPALAARTSTGGTPLRGEPGFVKVPTGFSMPAEWSSICDSIGPKGARLVPGTNCRYLRLDGVFRRWIVDIPRAANLSSSRRWPVVMVIHGSSSSSEEIRHRTNWPAMVDREGLIAVYPTAWRYKRLSNGRRVTRWNSFTLDKEIDLGERLDGYPESSPYPARDMVFLRRVMADLRSQVKVDPRHIHAGGSSQGGRFISRMAIEWADTFASMSCVGWCDPPPTSVAVPRRVSILYGIGSADDLVLDVLRQTQPGLQRIPVTWPAAGRVLRPLLRGHLRAWDLPADPANVTQTSTRLILQWRAGNRDPRWTTRFKVLVFNGLNHVYPSPWSNSIGVDFAAISWAFYRDNPMPPS
jgi:poly(3-hydroxybutyrate) depolymerase